MAQQDDGGNRLVQGAVVVLSLGALLIVAAFVVAELLEPGARSSLSVHRVPPGEAQGGGLNATRLDPGDVERAAPALADAFAEAARDGHAAIRGGQGMEEAMAYLNDVTDGAGHPHAVEYGGDYFRLVHIITS